MQIVKLLIGGIATASLSACSLIGWETPDDMDGNYRDAVEIAEIEVPEGLSSDAIQQMFPIPDVTENVAVPITGKTPRPLPLTAGSQLDAVRLQSLGGENWAVVNFAPGQLWPQVRAFLVTSGIDVAGIDATGDVARARDLMAMLPEGFGIYSGDDATTCDLLAAGAHGCISVTANICPADMALMCKMALSGNLDDARRVDQRLQPLHRDLFLEPNPVPVKYALGTMGLIDDFVRLPLTRLSAEHEDTVKQAVAQCKS